MGGQAGDSGKVRVCCPSCGASLTVCKSLAGRQGRCPRCKQTVAVPAVRSPDATSEADGSSDVTADRSSLYDLRLLDVPPEKDASTPVADSNEQEAAYRELQMRQGACLAGTENETHCRRLPWLIDIFLYPANKAGLSVLLVCVGVPFLMRAIMRFFYFAMGSFGPLFIFWVMFIILHWAAFAMAMLYANWYLCECIRDSADGGIRAADTTANTPGLGGILGQGVKVTLSVLVCMTPALIYSEYTDNMEGLFQILYGAGGFLVPMAVLAMAMYDTLRALNPALVLGSILKTPFQYCALMLFGCISCILVPMAWRYYRPVETWMIGSVLLFVTLYQLLIFAHLLGCFYRRNEERLNWDT